MFQATNDSVAATKKSGNNRVWCVHILDDQAEAHIHPPVSPDKHRVYMYVRLRNRFRIHNRAGARNRRTNITMNLPDLTIKAEEEQTVTRTTHNWSIKNKWSGITSEE